MLGTYWLTHIYVDALHREFEGDQRNLFRRTLSSAGSESAILEGGVPAIVVFVAASLLGGDEVQAAKIAIWFTVGLLALVGYLAARHSGRTRGAAYVEALGASHARPGHGCGEDSAALTRPATLRLPSSCSGAPPGSTAPSATEVTRLEMTSDASGKFSSAVPIRYASEQV